MPLYLTICCQPWTDGIIPQVPRKGTDIIDKPGSIDCLQSFPRAGRSATDSKPRGGLFDNYPAPNVNDRFLAAQKL